MHVFYTPEIEGNTYVLNEQESKHCTQVLRMNLGDVLTLVDGKGGFYTAEISNITKKQVAVNVLSKIGEYGKRPFYLHIALAPTKNIERTEWFLEKATEIGIDQVSMIICDRSERKAVKIERLEKVITSAVKQSIKAYHPIIEDSISFLKFIKQYDHIKCKYIAHCLDQPKTTLKESLTPSETCLILIGPEGDFTPNEIQLALDNGFKAISLGESRLRTETAALAACFEANYLNH
ncbi:16S rRNA (uracil(1498)-N(3))-methyltransferase [Pedobacter flavus]|uniref:Ribosomal RNA small subunit methyltransferase E n=1 Tax=Pedobacter flavus TaxID=3113906 RepID=A0ABU7H0T8_9SPHI|nr:16S rRNA (uracil(1498)-N(3))-methyltransferase [Pedobacter sp. VNH31]MEE1884648.1 16S rRNA (uracil(1498)-N(3))-methyltransferase [Pedobacter sp. VNH31]